MAGLPSSAMGARQAEMFRRTFSSTFMGRVGAFVTRILGQARAYVSNFTDRQRRIKQEDISVDTIDTALYQAWLGYLAPRAELHDLMFTHPIIKGLKKQLKAGVKDAASKLQFNPPANVAAGRAELAQKIVDDVRREIENNADAPFAGLVGDHIECELRGGGLIEVLWKLAADGRWSWKGFELVPEQRMRFDRYTSEPCFAESAFQFVGEPVSSFPRGTFIVVQPEKEVPDFSKRGTCRAILTDWFAMQNCAGWWQADLEFVGSPIVAAMYETEADRETMIRALSDMGASGRIAFRKGGDVKLIERAARTGPKGSSHNEFETTRVQRMSIAFLGAAQTVTIDQNTGSQSSSDNMAEVADEVVAAHWETFLTDVRRDLIQVFVELNYGLENADLTPIMSVDLEEPADANATLDAYTKADAIGLQVGEDMARKALKWPKLSPGEKPLGKPMVEPAASEQGTGGGPRKMQAPGDGTQTNKEAAA